jgi:hypothetical protein
VDKTLKAIPPEALTNQVTVSPEVKETQARQAELKKLLAGLKINTVPIMRELAGEKRRKTQLQLRGNYQALGEAVTEMVPAAFHPLPQNETPNRLALAKWLIDDNNPLTARVLANRLWEQIFGIGIVRTSEDFGSQGDAPTHPELLDWLATELMAKKWDMKAFLKMLVTSEAYCQTSRVTPALAERDPDNLLLARGPRFRMPAEVVRDQAVGPSAAAFARTDGGVREFARLENQRRRGPVSARPLCRVASNQPLPFHGHLRRAQPRGMHHSPAAQQYPPPGARNVE